MQTGNIEWPSAMCEYGAPLFVAIQVLRRIYDWLFLHSFLTHRVPQASFFFVFLLLNRF